MKVTLQIFQKLLTRAKKKLADSVEKKGGNAVPDDERAMKELPLYTKSKFLRRKA